MSSQQRDEFVVDDVDEHEQVASEPEQQASSSSAAEPKSSNPIKKFGRRTRTIWSQLTRSEISGSLGDLGTLIPLLVALARQRSVLLAPALFWAGIANILTGYKWDAPICVQPMKSIAAVALSELWAAEKVTAAGITTGGLIFVIGITNLIEVINVIVPPHVVSGIQIGVGLLGLDPPAAAMIITSSIINIAALDGLDGILDIDVEGKIVPAADQEELLEAVLLGWGEGGHFVGQDERGWRRSSIGISICVGLGLFGSRYQRRTSRRRKGQSQAAVPNSHLWIG